MSVDPMSSLGQLVTEQPSRSRVFDRFGLDYCCGGQETLADRCRTNGLDLEAVVAALQEVSPDPRGQEPAWGEASLTELSAHIVERHHTYLRTELPQLTEMARKVAEVHGERHPELAEVQQVFTALAAELGPHMMKEETILFPMLRQLDEATGPLQFHCGSVENPIRAMMFEHDGAGEALRRLKALTGNYSVPEDACPTYRALYARLQLFEEDMHQHIHKENNILFQAAIARNRELG